MRLIVFIECLQNFLNFFLILSSGRATIMLQSISTTALSGSVNRKVATFFGMIFSHPLTSSTLMVFFVSSTTSPLIPVKPSWQAFNNLNIQSHKFMPEYVLWSDHCSTMEFMVRHSKNMEISMFLSTSFPSPIFPVFNFDGV